MLKMTFLYLAVKVTSGAPSACLQGPWKRSLAPVLCMSLSHCSPHLQKLAPRPGPGGSTFLTSHLKGFSPECCKECTLRDMLRLNDFPQVSHVKGMSFVCAATQSAPHSE